MTGLLLLVAFVLVESRFASRPMMPLRLFRNRGVAVGNVMLLLFGAIAMAMWYVTSLLLQNVLGYSAPRAGLGQTPAAVTFVAIARWAAILLPRSGVRPLVLSGCGCLMAGFAWLVQADADSAYVTSVLGPTLLIAVGIGLAFPTLMAAAIAGGDSPAAGYHLVFLLAAGLALVIAVVSALLPHTPAGYEPSTSEWVREHVEQIVRTGTTDGVTVKGLPTVLITYRGARTGKLRKVPLMRVEHDGRYAAAAVASKGGAPTNPQWYAPAWSPSRSSSSRTAR